MKEIREVPKCSIYGTVTEVLGSLVRCKLLGGAVGDFARIRSRANTDVLAKIVRFTDSDYLLFPFEKPKDVLAGAEVELLGPGRAIHSYEKLLGKVLNCHGQILDDAGTHGKARLLGSNSPPAAISRPPVEKVFVTGIRAIDGLLTLGQGQRICVFAEPGMGKSSLLGSIARNSEACVNVIALVGERGREVAEFVNDTLGVIGRSKSVVVASTSDESPLSKIAAANTATTIAEYFRDEGKNVLLVMDSLTRLFRAYREIGLAAGEVPITHGYPPSAFSALPRLIERAGTSKRGSITALYTVLGNSARNEDPIVEEVKGLCDGHIELDSDLARAGQYPSISVPRSLSRLAIKLQDKEHQIASSDLRRVLSDVSRDRELIMLGAAKSREYQAYLNLELEIREFLSQELEYREDYQTTVSTLCDLAFKLKSGLRSDGNRS